MTLGPDRERLAELRRRRDEARNALSARIPTLRERAVDVSDAAIAAARVHPVAAAGIVAAGSAVVVLAASQPIVRRGAGLLWRVAVNQRVLDSLLLGIAGEGTPDIDEI